MKMRTTYKLVCECGNQGEIKLVDGDQTNSNIWERHSLQNLEGNSFVGDIPLNLQKAKKKTNVNCPNCKANLTILNLI